MGTIGATVVLNIIKTMKRITVGHEQISGLTYLSVLLAQVDSITQAYLNMVGTIGATISITQAYLNMVGTIGATIVTTIVTQIIHDNYYCIIRHQYVTIGHNHHHLSKNTPNVAKIQPTKSKNSSTPICDTKCNHQTLTNHCKKHPNLVMISNYTTYKLPICKLYEMSTTLNHNDADILLKECKKFSININFHIPSNHLYYEMMKIL